MTKKKSDKGWRTLLTNLRRFGKKLWTQVLRTPYVCAVLIFVAASTYCNFLFGLRIGHTIFAAAMAAGDVIKGFVWRETLRSSGWGRAVLLGLMGVLLSSFSLVSGFGSISFMRYDATSKIEEQNSALADARKREAELTQKLDTLPVASVLLQQIDQILDQQSPQKPSTKVRDHVGDCQGSVKPGFHVNTYCPQINDLRRRAEEATKERRKVEIELETVRKTISELGTEKDSDPQITMFSDILEKPRNWVMMMLAVFAALVLEAVSSFGLWAITPEKVKREVVKKAAQTRGKRKKVQTEKKVEQPKGKPKGAPMLNSALPVKTITGKHLKLVYSNDNLNPPPPTPSAMKM